jgi:hypothetical protein
MPASEAVRKSRGQTNSAAIPLFGRLIPLIGRQIPLFGCVGNFASDSNGISHLEGRVRPAKGRNRRFSLFFPSSRESGRSLRTMTQARLRDIDRGRTTAVARGPYTRWCERGTFRDGQSARAPDVRRRRSRCSHLRIPAFPAGSRITNWASRMAAR